MIRKPFEALREYADNIDPKQQPIAATPAAESVELPDVDTMIAKLRRAPRQAAG